MYEGNRMYLKRKIDLFLDQWKSDPNHKPLILRGPRQVGKTESIRQFAIHNYKHIVEINFVEEERYRTITSAGYSVDDIIKNITLLDPSKTFVDNETLLFFDEIQSFPEIA